MEKFIKDAYVLFLDAFHCFCPEELLIAKNNVL